MASSVFLFLVVGQTSSRDILPDDKAYALFGWLFGVAFASFRLAIRRMLTVSIVRYEILLWPKVPPHEGVLGLRIRTKPGWQYFSSGNFDTAVWLLLQMFWFVRIPTNSPPEDGCSWYCGTLYVVVVVKARVVWVQQPIHVLAGYAGVCWLLLFLLATAEQLVLAVAWLGSEQILDSSPKVRSFSEDSARAMTVRPVRHRSKPWNCGTRNPQLRKCNDSKNSKPDKMVPMHGATKLPCLLNYQW